MKSLALFAFGLGCYALGWAACYAGMMARVRLWKDAYKQTCDIYEKAVSLVNRSHASAFEMRLALLSRLTPEEIRQIQKQQD